MIYVVGSGPSGVTAAVALLAKGAEVCMLDTGLSLEGDRAEAVRQLRALPHDQWPPRTIAFLKGDNSVSSRGVEYKKVFGSDFPYRGADFIDVPAKGIEVKPSLAVGGLSNVWGAAILPAAKSDVADWPIPYEALQPHYEAVQSFLHVSGVKNRLDEVFPSPSKRMENLNLSNQARCFLETLERHAANLNQAGFRFGQSRLAVQAESSPPSSGCVYCGMCLYGCPYDLIYNSIHTLDVLKQNPQFHYQPGVNVQTLEEHSDEVVVHAVRLGTDEKVAFRGERIYLAAGPFSSTRIIMESQEAFDRELRMKTSQYFMLPFLVARGSGNVQTEPLHTLSQVFIELLDERISPRFVHLQFYSYNDMFKTYFSDKLGVLSSWFRPLTDGILSRLFIIQSFMHSSDSSQIAAKLKERNGRKILALSPDVKPRARKVVDGVLKKIKRHCRDLGGYPLTPFLHFGAVGDGNHTGGSYPMSQDPGEFDSDIAGRPFGFKRVHVVDSSVLPSIPGTTITLTIMANAHRIASMEQYP